jgi:hypothetical protein
VAEVELAGVGLGLPGKDAEKAGLAGAVQPHDQQALAALDLEIHIAEDDGTAVTLGQPLHRHDDAAAVRRVGKADLDLAFAFGSSNLLRLQAIDAFEDRFGGARSLFSLPAHHLGEQAQPLDLRLLPDGQ